MTPYPLSDRQLENLRAVFGRGVKKRNGRRLAGNPADFVNTLAGEFGVSAYGMVKICFIPPWPNSVLYAFFCPGQSMLKFFVSGGQSTPITLFYGLDGIEYIDFSMGSKRGSRFELHRVAYFTTHARQIFIAGPFW